MKRSKSQLNVSFPFSTEKSIKEKLIHSYLISYGRRKRKHTSSSCASPPQIIVENTKIAIVRKCFFQALDTVDNRKVN